MTEFASARQAVDLNVILLLLSMMALVGFFPGRSTGWCALAAIQAGH